MGHGEWKSFGGFFVSGNVFLRGLVWFILPFTGYDGRVTWGFGITLYFSTYGLYPKLMSTR